MIRERGAARGERGSRRCRGESAKGVKWGSAEDGFGRMGEVSRVWELDQITGAV